MSLVRAWMRALSGASGAALLVPAGVFAAMVLLALGGSFGQLGELGQAFAGPSTPNALSAASPAPTASGAGLLPVVSAAPATVATATAGMGQAGTGAGPTPGGTPVRPPATPTPRPAPPATPTPTAPPINNGCGSACTPPAPKPTVIDQLVSTGTSVTRNVPGPVGQLATQTLQQVGTTVDQLFTPHAVLGLARLGASAGAAVTHLDSALTKLR
jgi:hypothetical protein